MLGDSRLFHSEGAAFRLHRIRERADAYIAALLIIAMIVAAVVTLRESSPAIMAAFYGFGLTGAWISGKLGRTERRLFLVAYAVNVLFAIGLYYIYLQRYGAPYIGGGSDDRLFEETARNFVERFEWWNYPRLMTWYKVRSVTFYVYLVSLLQRLTAPLGGFHTLVPRFFNGFLLAWLSIFVFRAGKRHFALSHIVAAVAAGLLGVTPIAMYVSAHTFRDTLVALLLFALVYFWQSFLTYETRSRLLLIFVTPILLFILWETRERAAQIAILLIFFTVYIAYWENRFARFAGIALVAIGIAVVLLNLFTPIKAMRSLSWEGVLRQYQHYAARRADLGEGGLSAFIYKAPTPLALLLRIAYLGIFPLPTFSIQIERNLLSIGTIAQIMAAPFLAFGLFEGLRRRTVWSYLAGFVMLFLSVAWVTFTLRHFLMFYPFGILFVAYGYEALQKYRFSLRWVYLAFYFLAIAGGLVYFILKNA